MYHNLIGLIPNLLTISRLVAVPIIAVLFFVPGLFSAITVVILFVLASLSDYFDGYLARQWGTQSDFGRVMDPIADKLLVISVIVMLIYSSKDNAYLLIVGLIIIYREILVSGIRELSMASNTIINVTKLAKYKAATQMLAIFGLLVYRIKAPIYNSICNITNIFNDSKEVITYTKSVKALYTTNSNNHCFIANIIFESFLYIGIYGMIIATILTIVTGTIYCLRSYKLFKTARSK